MMIAGLVAIAVVVGCGGRESKPAATAPTGAASTALPRRRLLVYFKEVYGVDPAASYLTVYTSGNGVAVSIAGGVDGASVRRFQLTRLQLGRLRRLVERTRLSNTSCCDNLNGWIYWVTTPRRSARLQQDSVPAASRALVDDLAAITEKYTIY